MLILESSRFFAIFCRVGWCEPRLVPVLKTIFINVSHHILVASLNSDGSVSVEPVLKTEPSELRLATSI